MTAGWRGNFGVVECFWRYYLVGRIVAFAVGWVCFTFLGFFGWFIGILIWTGYWFWSLLALWNCAVNTDSPFLFYLARAIVIIDAVYAIANPPLFIFTP